ncbi:hypothetical protein G5647_09910 [Pectobacterium carotovorum]|uniref:hypothetical protein n=1 Tax=Pectobacterium carotovorum TaxID=554 RepID=UPI00191E9EFC|nr:hypothetical protein [Pectobacterium carotovorum]MBL0866740.1 hypothetical protein [Pectobacterium carotovorum]
MNLKAKKNTSLKKAKYLIALSTALTTMSPAHASQNYYIDIVDGEITLQDEVCPQGGRVASFIEKRDNGGGAYGCWMVKDKYVFIQWNTFLGPTGSILHSDKVDRYPLPDGLANKK